jgi:hypothetical protein
VNVFRWSECTNIGVNLDDTEKLLLPAPLIALLLKRRLNWQGEGEIKAYEKRLRFHEALYLLHPDYDCVG